MIFIRIHRSGDSIERIQVRGHASGVMGVRACHGVSVLSRTLLVVLGIEDVNAEQLQYGHFDLKLDHKRKSQAAARHTITGYRMIAKYAPDHVRIRTLVVEDERRSSDRGSGRSMSCDD